MKAAAAYWCVVGFLSRHAMVPSIVAVLLFIAFILALFFVRSDTTVTALHYYCDATVRFFNAAALIFAFVSTTLRRHLYIRVVRRLSPRGDFSRNACLIHASFVFVVAVYESCEASHVAAAYAAWYEFFMESSITLAYHSCVYILVDGFTRIEFRAAELSENMREHAQLCAISRDVNKVWGPATLGLVSLSFVRIVLSAFYALEAALAGQTLSACKDAARVAVAVCFVVVLAYSCQLATAASTRGHRFIHVAAHQQQDKLIINEFASAALQLSHNRAQFSAGGLVPIDGTLIFTMSGAATTYLVMLVQFAVAPRVQLATVTEFDSANTTTIVPEF